MTVRSLPNRKQMLGPRNNACCYAMNARFSFSIDYMQNLLSKLKANRLHPRYYPYMPVTNVHDFSFYSKKRVQANRQTNKQTDKWADAKATQSIIIHGYQATTCP